MQSFFYQMTLAEKPYVRDCFAKKKDVGQMMYCIFLKVTVFGDSPWPVRCSEQQMFPHTVTHESACFI
jgi:hypothetical protein